MAESEVLRRLGAQNVFGSVARDELRRLSVGCVIREVAAGQTLYAALQPADYAWLVLDGIMHSSLPSPSGEPVTLELFKQGDMFGTRICQDRGCYYYDVTGLVPSQVLGIPNGGFNRLLHQTPSLGEELLNDAAHRMRESMLLRTANCERSDRRICQVLLWMRKRLGRKIPTTRAMVAAVAGLTVETVSRVMAELSRRGLVSSRRGLILIEEPEKLQYFIR